MVAYALATVDEATVSGVKKQLGKYTNQVLEN